MRCPYASGDDARLLGQSSFDRICIIKGNADKIRYQGLEASLYFLAAASAQAGQGAAVEASVDHDDGGSVQAAFLMAV